MDDARTADTLARLAAMPGWLAQAVHRTPPARWALRPSPEAFSLIEHVCHLRDLEAEGYQLRIRRILAEDLPSLHEIDGSAWAIERRYRDASMADVLADFARHRATTVEMLSAALPRHASRKGLFGGFGIVTLGGLAGDIAVHDAGHRAEIEALMAARAEG